ncbi:hypothetical protein LTR15_009487 [Elasticomyces elasticus]|nr:hypothetical protein LTR15_009487 [Elasticomyces elasticus]
MVATKEFFSLQPPSEQKPRSAFNAGQSPLHNMFRDQLTITTWLCLGAITQGLLFAAIGRLAFAPAVLVVVYKVLLTYMQVIGLVRNPQMDGVYVPTRAAHVEHSLTFSSLMKKFSAQFPDEAGNYGTKPANDEICVFLIGARCNHPLGMFGPYFKEMGEFFTGMAKDLDAHAEEFGFLGMTNWTNAADRPTANESLQVCYFKNVEGLHAFAHSQYHRAGWDWWNKGYTKFPHLSIYHETYQVPKGAWENIYINSHASGITSTTSSYVDRDTGKTMWASPVVDASKGLLKTSAGRMSRSQEDSHEKMGVYNPY